MSKLIAERKKEENIAEYLLYMWQMEDLLRANDLDMTKVQRNIINEYDWEESYLEEERKWFQTLIDRMKKEGIQEKGHLEELNEIMVELYYLHNTLLNVTKDEKYASYFEEATPHLTEFKDKTQGTVSNDIEACFHGLYGLLVLRLKKEKVSKETETAMMTFRNVLAYLSQQYSKMKKGEFGHQWN